MFPAEGALARNPLLRPASVEVVFFEAGSVARERNSTGEKETLFTRKEKKVYLGDEQRRRSTGERKIEREREREWEGEGEIDRLEAIHRDRDLSRKVHP